LLNVTSNQKSTFAIPRASASRRFRSFRFLAAAERRKDASGLEPPANPLQALPPLAAPGSPWQPSADLGSSASPRQPLPTLGNPCQPLGTLGWVMRGDKGVSALTKNKARLQFAKGTLAICRGSLAIYREKKKERKKKRFGFGNRNCLKNSPLANCKRHPCNLQTTRLQFADGPLAICRRHAYILAIAPGEREAGVKVGGGWGWG